MKGLQCNDTVFGHTHDLRRRHGRRPTAPQAWGAGQSLHTGIQGGTMPNASFWGGMILSLCGMGSVQDA